VNVLFDVDGVLVEPFLFRAHLSAEHGIDPHMTRPFFDFRFNLCALGVQKPHAEYFAQIESALGCDPSHLVFVDDHAPNVTAAAARGWNAVLYRGEGSLAEVDQVLAT